MSKTTLRRAEIIPQEETLYEGDIIRIHEPCSIKIESIGILPKKVKFHMVQKAHHDSLEGKPMYIEESV